MVIITAINRLDKLLGGGLLTGELFELFGCSSVGKSQLCMQIATRLAASNVTIKKKNNNNNNNKNNNNNEWQLINEQHNCIYIDTSRAFAPKRVAEMYESFVNNNNNNKIDEDEKENNNNSDNKRIRTSYDGRDQDVNNKEQQKQQRQVQPIVFASNVNVDEWMESNKNNNMITKKPNTLTSCLSNIRVFKVSTLFQLFAVLEHIRLHLLSSPSSSFSSASSCLDPFFASCRLLVVDSLADVVAPLLLVGGNLHFQTIGLLSSLARQLRTIATMHNIAVVVSNHSSRPTTTNNNNNNNNISNNNQQQQQTTMAETPSLGEAWSCFLDVRLKLSLCSRPFNGNNDNNNNNSINNNNNIYKNTCRQASLFKSNKSTLVRWMLFVCLID